MKLHHHLYILLFSAACTVICGCDKQHASKLAGTYQCDVQFHTWNMNQTNCDSVYQEKVEVKRNGAELQILDYTLHIDSLWNEKEYYKVFPGSSIRIQFKDKQLYMTTQNGGLGGGTSKVYIGKKTN